MPLTKILLMGWMLLVTGAIAIVGSSKAQAAWCGPKLATYYRLDSRAAYVETVKTIVQRRIDEVTGEQGLQLTAIESLQPKELRNFASAMKRWTK